MAARAVAWWVARIAAFGVSRADAWEDGPGGHLGGAAAGSVAGCASVIWLLGVVGPKCPEGLGKRWALHVLGDGHCVCWGLDILHWASSEYCTALGVVSR